MGSYEMIPVEAVRREVAKRVNEKKVEQIRRAIEMGREIRPIVVSLMADGTYRIVGDGRHRHEAHLRAGCAFIAARVINKAVMGDS